MVNYILYIFVIGIFIFVLSIYRIYQREKIYIYSHFAKYIFFNRQLKIKRTPILISL